MKTRLLIIIVIVVGIVAGVLMALPNDSDKNIDPSSLEYLKALQNLCKQNENNGSVSMIDGSRWQNTTHYFDVPGCQFVPLVIPESKDNSDNTLLVPAPFVEFTEDEIVDTLLPLIDDSDAKKVYQNSKKVRYETTKAELSISAPRNTGLSHYVDYNIFDRNYTIPPEQAQDFVKSLLNKIGYETDGSEYVQVEESYHNTKIVIHQTKDGMKIANEMNRFQFRDRSTLLEITHWYDNLDEYDLKYSPNDAKNIAHDYLVEFVSADPKLRDMDIVIGKPQFAFVELKAIDNRLVYSVSKMYFHLEIQVDAVTGDVVNADTIKITGKEIPGCAGVGVSKLTQQDIEKIEERVGELLYYELVDDDLNQLPVLKEMVDATTSRTEYNDRVRLPIFIEEWNDYKIFFKEKFDQQHDEYYESDLQSNYVLYGDKIYTIRYNENYADTPFTVEMFPANIDYDHKAITILNNETGNIPKFVQAIELMGTWEVSVRNSTGILESEQQRYQSYLFEKNTEKFGLDAEEYARIFYYDGNYYEPSFTIC
ncbi:MAG: hypothetical protein ACW9W4_10395 [Candidatus Nitrosopumilus sp. bin_7KS]